MCSPHHTRSTIKACRGQIAGIASLTMYASVPPLEVEVVLPDPIEMASVVLDSPKSVIFAILMRRREGTGV